MLSTWREARKTSITSTDLLIPECIGTVCYLGRQVSSLLSMLVIELLDTRLQILLQCQYSQGESQAELKCDLGVDKPVRHCRLQTARITWQLQKQKKVCQDPF